MKAPYYPQVCHRINCSTVLSALSVLISDSNSKKRDNIYYATIRCILLGYLGYPYLLSKLTNPQMATRNGTKEVRPTFHSAGYSWPLTVSP